ncbi:MAG TPA: bifunctional nuclease family protein [Thermoleophilia bacterium]|nr:bifunctional nuclease family protein [Thermoleophilia bacterium]HQJ98508.1 bifunctional nuclease family protein [Thermoleophilia bacterium]
MDVQQMVIYGVSFDVIGKQPIVLLKTVEGNKFLPIWIGHPEAAAILIKLQGTKLPRPMTHDLLTNLIGRFDAQLARITVTELKDSTFYATLTLLKDGAEIDIDSRPSDALALAVRTHAPIYASTELILENAIEFEHEVDDTEEIIEGFRDFLEKVSPEDFNTAEVMSDEALYAERDMTADDEEDEEGEEDEEDEEDDDEHEGLDDESRA